MTLDLLLRLFACLTVACTTAAPAAQPAQTDIAPKLLRGVTRIAAPGVPGSVVALAPTAEPIVAGRAGKNLLEPVIVAGTAGPGRIVAFGHTSYLSAAAAAEADTGILLCNAIHWARGAHARDEAATVAVIGGDLSPYLNQHGFKATDFKTGQLTDALGPNAVAVLGSSDLSDAQLDELRAFLARGRGLVVAQTGWGWQQLNGGKDVALNPLNRLLAPHGIAFTDGTVEKTAGNGFAASAPPPDMVHAGRAVDALIAESAGTLALADDARTQAVESAALAVRHLPPGDTLIRPRLAALFHSPTGIKYPSKDSPLRAKDGLSRVLVALQLDDLKSTPADRIKAHPAAADFPGAPPADAPTVEHRTQIDTFIPDWHSLGVYARPGSVVTVTFAGLTEESVAKAKLRIRIGSHTDSLWHHDRWERMPEISRLFPVVAAQTKVASAFGGLVYIDVPARVSLAPLLVTVTGAVRAPLFILGTTTPQQWREVMRGAPGPWAEIAAHRVIVTVPSSTIRDLDDPTPVAELWDRIADAAADLAAIPRERTRPERYVADVQISAGYMHSGYPIMTHLDAAPAMAAFNKLKAGQWGLFHELGHNHQDGMWTFDGTGEVTCNLFSMYIIEEVCGIPKEQGHSAVADRAKRMEKYFGQPVSFDRWKADPFTALVMYSQLRDAFGWEAYKKVFAEYRALPRDLRPRTEEQKRDQWMMRMSRTVGHDLGPFFHAWGVPISEGARTSVRDLPPWMPPDMPITGEPKPGP